MALLKNEYYENSIFPLLACNLWAINSVVAQNARPNIIMFLVDDMGWQDTSVPFNGNEVSTLNLRYQTPNMERLARLGVKFTQAYSCAISSPTRCSLMSGMNASRHRVTNWTLEFDQKQTQTAMSLNCLTGIIMEYNLKLPKE